MSDYSYQLYSSRNFPPLSDTLRMIGDLGYSQAEGYGGLFSAIDDLSALKADLHVNNLSMPTGHFGLEMVEDETARVIDIARTLGMNTLFVPAVGPEERTKDAAGWEALGVRLAEAGKPIRDAGFNFGWHNHAFEFADLGIAEKPLDLMLQGNDLALELDLAWVQVGGEDPLKYIARYADRIIATHIKDIAPEGEATDEDGWADVGRGIMDWPALVAALRETSVQYWVMEHDNPNDHERFARRSLLTAQNF
ncbi:MAG: sugar phosphate isomerase/epimerase family protein [Boseongicola sp.]